MKLFLMRHGDAQKSDDAPRDRDRRLTDKGKTKLIKEGGGFRRIGLDFDAIWSSPYVRAKETAEIIAEQTEFRGDVESYDALTPGGNFEAIRQRLQGLKSSSRILMVGHAPDLGLLASELCFKKGAPEIPMKKGGLIRIDIEDWSDAPPGELRWVLTGKQVRWMRKKKADRAWAEKHEREMSAEAPQVERSDAGDEDEDEDF
ncbi:MAG: phosphohistidine phosphatase SixA [Planctomycetes bacterium]|nr:phosphohistidine phosphatase SixA [Planctomycetota bacterium]